MIQINPLQSYIDGGPRAAITSPPSASLVFDLPGRATWVKGVKLKGTDHTYTFNHDNYITLTNTPDSNESEDIKIGVNTSALKSAIDTTYGVVSTTANGLAPKFISGNKLAATAATTYYFLGWTGTTLKWYQAPFRNIRINSETTDCLGVNSTDPLIISAGNGINVTWDSTNKKIVITNSKPDVNHNTDRTGIKLATVSGTKKTDSTLILANSTTGLNIQGGTNKFLIGDGTNYIEVPVTPSFTISNKNATIGTALTTIATIAGVDIKAKIASYSLSNHTHSVKINGSTKTIAASGAVDLGNYLPLSGGTMGGTAWIVWPDSGNWSNNNSGVTFPVTRGGLQWSGLSDYVKLFTEETSNDNLNLVLQFGDDNSNGLSIRNASNVQTSHISAGGVITTKTFKGNLDWSYITNKPSSYTPSAHTHAWNSLTHSSTTENQAILTNGSANGWKLYTLNISGWNNAANNAHSHSNKSVLDGITSSLVNNWNTAYNFVNTISGTDTDKVINKWDEIVNFLAGISEDDKLNTLLNSKLSILLLTAKDILTTKTNNALFWVNTISTASSITTGPFTDHPYALLSVTNYSQNDINDKFFYRSRLAFSSTGDIKVASCHHENVYKLDETWYNILTSKNSGINGSTIKLNGTSITVYSSSTADGRFVKKAGDTMSGALTVGTTSFGTLTIKRNDDTNGASIQFRGNSNVYGYIGLNNSTKDKLFLRWSSDTSKTYIILDTSSTYVSNGKGIINGTTITLVDNADKLDGIDSTKFLRQVVVPNNTENDFNTFSNMTLTGRVDPTTGASLKNAPWSGSGPAGGYGVLTYLFNGSTYGTQMAWGYDSNRIYVRNKHYDGSGIGSIWGTLWDTLAFTTDIPTSLKNPYALTISLNGASLGAYDGSAAKSINITPNSIGAATSGHNHDGRYVYNYGGTQMDGSSINKNALGMTTSSGITGDWWHILQAAWNGEYRWNSLIAFPTLNRNGMYYRSGLDDNTAWGSWIKLLDIGNSYVTGGKGVINGTTITQVDNATNANNANVASKVYGHVGDTGSHELVRCDMNNDQFRIIAGSNGNNNGWAEIATAAGGNEPIYVRQYTDVFSTLKRTLTLLDGSGNTILPGSATATGFNKSGSSNSYVLLGGGGHKLVSDFATSAQGVGTIISISKSLTPTTSWIDTGIKTDSATFPEGNGSYIVQISVPSSSGTDGWGDLYTGYFSLYTRTDSSTEDEILLHGASHALLKRIYLKTKATANTDGTMHFYIASEKAFSAARTINFKFRKLI